MNLHSSYRLPLCFFLIVGLGCVDFFQGFQFSLFPLYLIPLALAAWSESLRATMGLAVLASVPIGLKHFVLSLPEVADHFRYWDGSVKILLLLGIAYAIHRERTLVRQKDRNNLELSRALSEIQELREMIPICAWCHSIRNDQGFYERIEVYLSQLTGAQFTHGICPACKEKYYGDLGNDSADTSDKESRK